MDEEHGNAFSREKKQIFGTFCASRIGDEDEREDDGLVLSIWRSHRMEALSEMAFFKAIFAWTTLLEVLPLSISSPLSVCFEGKTIAQARQLWPPPLILDLLVYFPAWYTCAASWTSGLAIGIQSLTLLANMIARALTIGTKYAHYGRRDLSCEENGMKSKLYAKTERIQKNQISQILFNLNGHQLGVLVEQLYVSSLVKDTNLACSSVKFASPQEASDFLARMMKTLEIVRNIDGQEVEKLNENPQDNLNKIQDLENVNPGSAVMPTGDDPRVLLHSKYSLNPRTNERLGMFHLLVNGRSKIQLQKMAEEGMLPSSLVALDAVWSTHHVSQKLGSKLVWLPLLVSFCLQFLPYLIDGAMGHEAFGTTPLQVSFAASAILPGAFFQWLIFMYAWAPAYFQYLSRKRESYLYAMIGDDDADDFSIAAKPPKIDLTNPQNIVSYSAIWRVLHGNNFARTMQKRFSMYLVITFSVIIFGAAKSVLTQYYGITVEGRLGSKFSSIAVLCIFSFFVSLQIVAAWMINDFTKWHINAVNKARMMNLTLASVEKDEEKKETLLTSDTLLDALSTQMSDDENCNPVRVAFFRANIALITSIGTILLAILVYDLQAIANEMGVMRP